MVNTETYFFDRLNHFKKMPMAVYGLGAEAEKLLMHLTEYPVVGLLDSFRENGEMFGKPIISLEKAVAEKVSLILVAARPGSCRAIAKQIGDFCSKHGIILMDVRGKNLLEKSEVSYDFSGLCRVTKSELMQRTKDFPVISFDLFDTLIMRLVPCSEDVIAFVDCRLREQGIVIEDFCHYRLASEKELSRDAAPSLEQIYQHMLDGMKNRGADKTEIKMTASQLAELEWEIDFNFLIPRKEVCEVFMQEVEYGKSVYVVSDTYYNKQKLMQILEKCELSGYVDILASSDYMRNKVQGLFQFLKDREYGKKIIHIGDDIVADVEGALSFGLETCKLYRASELFEHVGSLGLEAYEQSVADRLKIGMFCAQLFNSPFSSTKEENHIKVNDSYAIGYLFCAPMITDFVLWLYAQMEVHEPANIWFGARDGYLIQKMYAHILALSGVKDETTYFLTSRTAAVRAGIENEEDIHYVDCMKFSGTLEESLKKRFGIEAGKDKKVSAGEDVQEKEGLIKYKDQILLHAENARSNYKKYISGLKIKEGEIAFFDFVAKGTSQMYVQRLVDNPMKGFYFLQLEADAMRDKGLKIYSFYDGSTNESAIYENYYILETLLTAPHPSVTGFDEEGCPLYASDPRSYEDMRCFKKAQDGILDYLKLYLRYCPKLGGKVNKGLDEALLKLLHEVIITDSDFVSLKVEDPFFNRVTDMRCLL